MKLFSCSSCHQIVYFENSECLNCGHALAYVADIDEMTALEPAKKAPPGNFVALAPALRKLFRKGRVRMCGNHLDHQACNWALREDDPHRLCEACRLNEVIPDLSEPDARTAWIKIEQAKRRLIYQLLTLGLPVEPRNEAASGLAFAFKKDVTGEEKVMIGQESGLVTLNIAEADSPFREKMRRSLGESYRTLLGHFRHESGHYYFERLVQGSKREATFRELFGDERASYEQALEIHYRDGAPANWPTKYVSSYSTMHPHEDWAESWAHYLHMRDTLETARTFGIRLRSKVARSSKNLEVAIKDVHFDDFDELSKTWVPLTVALNSLNRSMGLPDLYPFVLPAPALQKIRFVDEIVQEAGRNKGRR